MLDGPAWTRLPAPLEELPMLVRAGARIPVLPPHVLTLTSDRPPPIRYVEFVPADR